jgi:hypothetical protein
MEFFDSIVALLEGLFDQLLELLAPLLDLLGIGGGDE